MELFRHKLVAKCVSPNKHFTKHQFSVPQHCVAKTRKPRRGPSPPPSPPLQKGQRPPHAGPGRQDVHSADQQSHRRHRACSAGRLDPPRGGGLGGPHEDACADPRRRSVQCGSWKTAAAAAKAATARAAAGEARGRAGRAGPELRADGVREAEGAGRQRGGGGERAPGGTAVGARAAGTLTFSAAAPAAPGGGRPSPAAASPASPSGPALRPAGAPRAGPRAEGGAAGGAMAGRPPRRDR